jgi:hypothetical protein
MVPFQVDPSWYERYWWREQPIRRRTLKRSALMRAAAVTGRFLRSALRFLGLMLVLIASGDFDLPRCSGGRGPAGQRLRHPVHDLLRR